MVAPNTTGRANPDQYLLGRGIIYAASLHPTTGRPLAWRDLGNGPLFNWSMTRETLDHVSSRSDISTVDKQVTTSRTGNISIQLEEFNAENLALTFMGEKTSPTNPAVAGFSQHIAYEDVELGRYYDIVDANGNKVYGIDPDDLTVESGASTLDDELVLGTDYEVDAEFGRVFLLSTSEDITAGGVLGFTLAPNAYATATVNQVSIFTKPEVVVALAFISDNPAASSGNKKGHWFFPKVNLAADGDVALIGTDWANMPLTGVAQPNEIAYPNRPYGWITSVPVVS